MKSANFGYRRIIISLITALVIVFAGVSPIYLIVLGGLGSIVINKIKKDEDEEF